MDASPYKEDDLYRPADEGRSLHDDARDFYQEIMGLQSPITIHNIPSLDTITKSFQEMPKNYSKHHKFLINLMATDQKDLWPNKNYIPKTKEGMLFNAAKKMVKGSIGRAVTPSPTQDFTNVVNKSAKRSKHDSESNKKMRKRGKKWHPQEVLGLLDAVEEVKPCGRAHWEIVAALHYENGYKFGRDGDSCKLKFDRLWQTKKPTGTAEIPVHIARALDIKDSISKKECIGNSGLNDVEDEDDIGVLSKGGSPSNVISSTHLSDSKGIHRPSTRKNKVSNIAEAISSLGTDMKEASHEMAAAVSGRQNDKFINLQNKVSVVETKVDRIDENLKTILDYIKNK